MADGTVSYLDNVGCTHESPNPTAVEVCTASLSVGGQLFIWSIRRWRDAMAQRESLDDALAYTYGVAAAQRCGEVMRLVDVLGQQGQVGLAPVQHLKDPTVTGLSHTTDKDILC